MQFQNKESRFHEVCPRKLQNLPAKACPLALLRLEMVRLGKRETADLPGCAWACTSAQDSYCFWSMANRDDFSPMSTKEISEALSLSSAQAVKTEQEALLQIKSNKDSKEVLQNMLEQMHDLNMNQHDDSIYITAAWGVEQIEGIAKESGAIAHTSDDLSVEDLSLILKARQNKNKKKSS